MQSTSCRAERDLLLYYGTGKIDTLREYERVVLQPDHYSSNQVETLVSSGTQALAYLSVGEDTGPPGPWQLQQRNPIWGGHYVDLGHEGWQRSLVDAASRALAMGFTGLLLDTLETPPILTRGAVHLPHIATALRRVVGDGWIIANRAHYVSEAVGPFVDAFLLESFSTTWEDDYRGLRGRELSDNTARLSQLLRFGKPVHALDYSNRNELTAFAVSRGTNLGLTVQVTNRDITCLPADPS